MRRKSERTKEKEKSSPEKKPDKAPRRSRRQSSRRRKRSVSTSPERDESGAEENETSIKSSQEDTEEEQTTNVEESSCQVGAIITADTAEHSEVEDSQPLSSRKRSSKKLTQDEDEKHPTVSKSEIPHENEWKEDDTFWEEGDAVPESSDHKHKEKDGRSPVWKVKRTDGGGGEIQKLKLCIVRPQESTSDSSVRKRKRLQRTSESQSKEKIDGDDESGKGESQGEEEKLSSDERSSHQIENQIDNQDTVDKVKLTSRGKLKSFDNMEGTQIQISAVSDELVKEEIDTNTCEYSSSEVVSELKEECQQEDQEKEVKESVCEETDVIVINESEIETNVKEQNVEEEEEENQETVHEEASDAKVCEEHELVKDSSDADRSHIDIQEPSKNESDVVKDVCLSEPEPENEPVPEVENEKLHNEETPTSPSAVPISDNIDDKDDSSSLCDEKTDICKEKCDNVYETDNVDNTPNNECSSTIPDKECVDNVPEVNVEVNTSEQQEDQCAERESDREIEVKDPPLEVENERDGNEREARDDGDRDRELVDQKENLIEPESCNKMMDGPSPDSETTQSPERRLERDVTEPEISVVGIRKESSASSDDEKETSHKEEKDDDSPKHIRRDSDNNCHKITENENSSQCVNQRRDSNDDENCRHKIEKKAYSPPRREKVSLRRSFSGRNDPDTKCDDVVKIKREKHDYDDVNMSSVENKEADERQRRSSGETEGSTRPNMPRKRRWGQSNSSRPSKRPVLSISTDSLKTLIPGAKPLPIDEVQLNQEEEVKREREIWENVREDEKDKLMNEIKEEISPDKKVVLLPDVSRISVAVTDDHQSKLVTRKISIVSDDARNLQRSPSPPRHKASNVLFITNLVRPFTVNQLKELLARTGKIIESGFWIDKIKSKCYVEYDKESEAKETRHALHGVRWPVSNPKTLCVDFGKKEDMELAQAVSESDQIPRKTELLKVERNVEGWVAEQIREKEQEREVRDLRDHEKEKEKERNRGKERPHGVPAEVVEHNKKLAVREWDLGKLGQPSSVEREMRYEDKNREREKKIRKDKGHRSRSPSPHEAPVRKSKKKEEDAPAKLLDDLFRKTKTTPCIYWLPLTAEQIVVKEEIRRKHMAEHERRMAEIRKAERERERIRAQQRQQRRANEREKRRRRSGSGSPKK